MIKRGYEVDVLMAAYRGEFEDGGEQYERECRGADPPSKDVNFNKGYFGFNVHPYETIFVKANRDVDPNMIEKFAEWHDNMNYSSWDVCERTWQDTTMGA